MTMFTIPLGAIGFGISADEALIGLLSPNEVGKTGAEISGLAVWVGTLVSLALAFPSSGGTETGGGPGRLGGNGDTTSVDDAAAASGWPGVADDIVPCFPGVTMAAAIPFVVFGCGISADEA
jgi:hypothetical protein